MALNPLTGVLITEKKTHRHPERGGHVIIEADWIYTYTNQRTAKVASSHQMLGERPERNSPSEPPERINTASTLILDSSALEL